MRIFFFILFTLLLYTISARSQNGPATWYELEFSKKIIKGLSFEVVPEFRLNPDFTRNEFFIESGLEYKLFKPIRIAAYYRYYEEKKKKEDEKGHRYIFDIKSDFEIKRFEFQGRIRYIDYFLMDNNESLLPFIRYRIKIDYNLKKINVDPFVSAEFFRDFTNKEWHKIRYTAGAKYNINKKHQVSLFYRIQDFVAKNELLHIIGLGYSLKI